MKNDWLITFRSVTFAQRGDRALRGAGVEGILQRTPKQLSERGCGYCLRIRGRDAMPAVALLRERAIPFGKLYALTADGRVEERAL